MTSGGLACSWRVLGAEWQVIASRTEPCGLGIMCVMRPEVRFGTSLDGTRIAYTTVGSGPPLLVTPHNSLALEQEMSDAFGGQYFEALAARFTVIYYDSRNVGLSSRTGRPSTLEQDVEDLDAVASASGFDRFALYGSCQLGPAAAAYAAKHSRRVSSLILYATISNGRRAFEESVQDSIMTMVTTHWPMASRVIADMWAPGNEGTQLEELARAIRESIDPDPAAWRIRQSFETSIDDLLPQIVAPVLVLHRDRDRLMPSSEAAEIARRCQDAELRVFLGSQHWQWLGETDDLLDAVLEFLNRHPDSARRSLSAEEQLSPRQRQILRLVATGMRNREIADELGLSIFTVNRHVSGVLSKLDVTSRTEAVHRARELELL